MDSDYANSDFVPSRVSSNDHYSQLRVNFTEEQESEKKDSPSKWTKALLILLGLTLVFALGGLCALWIFYNNKLADFESLNEQLAAQVINGTVMIKEQEELRTNCTRVNEQLLLHIELKRMQQYEVDVTLDPDTAHPSLILSDDGKQVRCGDIEQKLPDKPERFNTSVCVLGKEGFSSGRFYFEVQVKGKTDWALGVARESIDRKRKITLTPSRGFWTVWLRNGNEYEALSSPSVSLSLRVKPQRVGVFVDYEEGLVSFYDVKSSSHIYSFTGQSFTGKLYPFFSPFLNNKGKNSAPLILTPVKYNK
ncbi:erythroid membrane-associated protein-like [Megalobrama amblycephala]|uniref:erythroid membrane-associated protein-like n=1 Tax=Megalobrama amblycephala TaxID=75352 RepID=UPI002013FE77|nr:erythroid membrane-associated protein-like [Megalobrama amblycephala]